MKALLLTLISVSAFAQMGASPGSVYSPMGRLADAARDLRAGQVDDIVTIVVNENASAVASSVTNTARKSSAMNWSIFTSAAFAPSKSAMTTSWLIGRASAN